MSLRGNIEDLITKYGYSLTPDQILSLVRERIKKAELSREDRHGTSKKWGDSNPGVGGIRYVEELVLQAILKALEE